jgi:hypothetical protein
MKCLFFALNSVYCGKVCITFIITSQLSVITYVHIAGQPSLFSISRTFLTPESETVSITH